MSEEHTRRDRLGSCQGTETAMKIERERHEVVLTGVPGNSVEIDIINFLCNVDIDVENIKIVDGSAYNGTKEVWLPC